MSNQDRFKPVQAIPTNAVRSAMRVLTHEARGEQEERTERIGTEFFGQQAGVPGMGEAPALWHEPAGSVLERILHPAFTIVEREFRVLPEQGWFSPTVNRERPIEFQLGDFKVEDGLQFWLVDYEFQVFRPSGIDPGDFVVAAPGRFSNQIGFDVTAGGTRIANLNYQLDPQPVFRGRPEFEPQIGSGGRGPSASDPFNNAVAQSFASTSSAGTSLLPRRPNVQGPRGGPFTFVIGEGSKAALNVVIFNPLTAPIAAISGRLAGWTLHTNVSKSLLARIRPR